MCVVCRTHFFAQVTRWTAEDGFFVQPFNSCGDKDGNALAEEPSNVFLLPEVTRRVQIGTESRDCVVDDFVVPNAAVTLTYKDPQPAAQPADSDAGAAVSSKKPKKTKPKKRKGKPNNKNKNVKRKKGPNNKKRKGNKKPPTKKAKKRKKAMDKVTTSDTAASVDVDTRFTLEAVLSSYAQRKGACTCGGVHMTITYDCSHMIVHI